jgi:hypothetical protein
MKTGVQITLIIVCGFVAMSFFVSMAISDIFSHQDCQKEKPQTTIEESDVEVLEETDREALQIETETEKPTEKTTIKDHTILINRYVEFYNGSPLWIEGKEGFSDGWYIAFPCYNKGRLNVDFLVEVIKINGQIVDIPEAWETVYLDSDIMLRIKLADNKQTEIQSIEIAYEIFYTDSDGPVDTLGSGTKVLHFD